MEAFIIDLGIYFTVTAILYGLYVIVSTKINIHRIRAEYLTDAVIREIKKQNSEDMSQIEKRLKAKSMIYIDSNFNQLNTTLDRKIKRLIENFKT